MGRLDGDGGDLQYGIAIMILTSKTPNERTHKLGLIGALWCSLKSNQAWHIISNGKNAEIKVM